MRRSRVKCGEPGQFVVRRFFVANPSSECKTLLLAVPGQFPLMMMMMMGLLPVIKRKQLAVAVIWYDFICQYF